MILKIDQKKLLGFRLTACATDGQKMGAKIGDKPVTLGAKVGDKPAISGANSRV